MPLFFPPCRKSITGGPALLETTSVRTREMRSRTNTPAAYPMHFSTWRNQMSNSLIGMPFDVAAGTGIQPIREISAVED